MGNASALSAFGGCRREDIIKVPLFNQAHKNSKGNKILRFFCNHEAKMRLESHWDYSTFVLCVRIQTLLLKSDNPQQ